MRYLSILLTIPLVAQTVSVRVNQNFLGGADFRNATYVQPFRQVGSAPSGACSNAAEWAQLTTTGALYYCFGGTWTLLVTGAASVAWDDVTGKPTLLLASSNLSDVANAATARGNLGAAPTASPTFTGTVTLPTPSTGDDSTKGATTAWVKLQTYLTSATAASTYEPILSAGTNLQYYRGDKTFQTLNTSVVPESGNLYFTNGRAQTALSGLYELPLTFSSPLSRSTNTISLSDSGVTAASYGSGSLIPVFTVDSKGRITAVTETAVSGTGGLPEPGANGIAVRTGSGTSTARSIAVGSSKLSISNADGVSGNPTLDILETNLTSASGSTRGLLSAADWTTFNGKEAALTFSSPLSRSTNTISLADSGATAGTYGSDALVPVVTVDAKGRVTAISTVAVTTVPGPPGADGVGIQGIQGVQGIPGVGARLYFGTGAPTLSSGVNDGDAYNDKASGTIYLRTSGAWVLDGEWYSAGVAGTGTPALIMKLQTAPAQPTYTVGGSPINPCASTSDTFIQFFFDTSDAKTKSINCAGTVKTYAAMTDLTVANLPSGDKAGTGSKVAMTNSLGTAGVCLESGASGIVPAASGLPCSSGGGSSATGSYTSALNFGVIVDGGCSPDLTFAATGVTTSGVLSWGRPSSLEAGLSVFMHVSASDTMAVNLCYRDPTGTAPTIDPASANFTVRYMDGLGYISGTATLGSVTIQDGNCASLGTITVTGAAAGDNTAFGFPATFPAKVQGLMYSSASNTVTAEACNMSGAEVTISSLSYKAGVTK